MIEKLFVISSYRKGRGKGQGVTRKRSKFKLSFAHFSECELELTEVGKDERGKYVPYRWQRMNEIMPDWDIFIDDNPNIVNETIKNVPDPDKNKICVLPDYKNCRGVKGDNVYHVKTTISDLKDEDFVKAAEEYRNRNSQKNQQVPEQKDYQTWIIYGILIGIVLALFFVIFCAVWAVKKKKKIEED